jgi:hypothetical protein
MPWGQRDRSALVASFAHALSLLLVVVSHVTGSLAALARLLRHLASGLDDATRFRKRLSRFQKLRASVLNQTALPGREAYCFRDFSERAIEGGLSLRGQRLRLVVQTILGDGVVDELQLAPFQEQAVHAAWHVSTREVPADYSFGVTFSVVGNHIKSGAEWPR